MPTQTGSIDLKAGNAIKTMVNAGFENADGKFATKSEVQQTADSITSSVAQTYTTKEEFDGLEIGGRNLLLGSDKNTISGTGSVNKGGYGLSQKIPKGTIVIVSVQIDADNVAWTGSGSRRLGFEINQATDGVASGTQYIGVWWGLNGTTDNGAGINYNTTNTGVTTFHGRIWSVNALTRDFDSYEVQPNRWGIYIQNVSGGTVTVSKPKIEIGNKATDWTPAPEDIETRMTSAETTIQQTANNVLIKATQNDTTAAQGGQHLIESLINVAPSGVTINADKVNIEGATIFTSGRLSTTSVEQIASSASSDYTNLIKNGSFWNGTNGWVKASGSDSFTVEADATYGHCLKFVQSASGGTSNRFLPDTASNFTHAKDKTYRLSFYAKTNAANTVTATIATSGQDYVQRASIGTSWQKYEGRITPTSTGALSFFIGSAGTLWLANVVLVEDIAHTAIDTSQRIYYRTNVNSSTPSAPSSWVTRIDEVNLAWTTKRVPYNQTYKYLYTCEQRKAVDGSFLGTTAVLLDDTTTIIDGSNIITGTVTASQIAAGAITAQKLNVGDTQNYSALDTNTALYYGFSYDETVDGRWYTMTSLGRDHFISPYYDCNGGEKFRVMFEVSSSVRGRVSSTATSDTYLNVGVGAACYKDTGGGFGWPMSSYVTSDANATPTTVNSIITLPNDTRRFSIFVQINGVNTPVAMSGTFKIRNLRVYKMYTGELIVDGSIAADKIDATNLHVSAANIDGTLTIGKLPSTVAQKSDVSDAIDAVEIGGRNLFADSKTLPTSKWAFDQGATRGDNLATLAANANSRIYQLPANGYWSWKPNTEYVVSVEAKASASGGKMTFNMVGAGGSKLKTFDLTTSWARYSWAFTSDATVSTGSASIYNSTTTGTVQVRLPKLEEGNKPTDWTPAPEDVEAGISNAAKTATNYIEQDSTGIKIRMTGNTSTYQHQSSTGTKFYVDGAKRSEVGADGLKVYIGSANSEVSVAEFGSTVRLGKNDEGHMVLGSTSALSSMDLYDSSGQDVVVTVFGGEREYHRVARDGTYETSGIDFLGGSETNGASIVAIPRGGSAGNELSLEMGSASTTAGSTLGMSVLRRWSSDAYKYDQPYLSMGVNSGGISPYMNIGVMSGNKDGLINIATSGTESALTFTFDRIRVFTGWDQNASPVYQGIFTTHGVVNGDQSVTTAANSYKDFTVSFGHTYSSAPNVVVGFYSTSTASGFGGLSCAVNGKTTTGCTIRVFNNTSTGRAPGVEWIAIGD